MQTPRAERELGAVRAVLHALFRRDISYYPRIRNEHGVIEGLSEAAVVARISGVLGRLQPGQGPDLKDCIELGRESLDEVKSLTEYQDQKATRLLTIITFLSALSGVLFSRFADGYPLWPMMARFGLSVESLLVGATYAFFALFVLSAVCGALVVFHATRTRFKYPKIDPRQPVETAVRTASHLFYSGIAGLDPAIWAQAFTAKASDNSEHDLVLDPELQLRYMKDYVTESYLVAAKVADKLRYLEPAQQILLFSIRFLLVWLLLVGLTGACVRTGTDAARLVVPAAGQARSSSPDRHEKTTVDGSQSTARSASPKKDPTAGTSRERQHPPGATRRE
jgi:hypothetical protein